MTESQSSSPDPAAPAATTSSATDSTVTGLEPPRPRPSREKKTNAGPVVAALAVGALLGGASGAGVAILRRHARDSDATQSQGSTPQTITVNDADNVTAVTAVAAKASPSVVTIAVSASSARRHRIRRRAQLRRLRAHQHPRRDARRRVRRRRHRGHHLRRQALQGEGRRHRPDRRPRRHQARRRSGLQPIEFADSGDLNVGDQAVAIGAPLGLANTVTDGIVSALNRSIQIASSAVPDDTSEQDSNGGEDDNGDTGPFDFWNFGQDPDATTTQSATISIPVVQTDAAINPGNSGGALVNSKGELIGVNVAIASAGGSGAGTQSGSIGVGFAIPSNLAKRVADEIIADGSATHGLLGATVKDATSDTSATVGAEINEVTDGGAAETAGLKPGDVITTFNDTPITGSTDLTAQVRSLAAGTTTSLTYVRGGDAHTVDVKLGSLK